jgi:hypothetical protein
MAHLRGSCWQAPNSATLTTLTYPDFALLDWRP